MHQTRVLLSGLTPPVFYYLGGFRLVADYARDNPVYHVHVDSPTRPPLPPSNTATKTPNLPAPRKAGSE
jgi:hypothetical protein